MSALQGRGFKSDNFKHDLQEVLWFLTGNGVEEFIIQMEFELKWKTMMYKMSNFFQREPF